MSNSKAEQSYNDKANKIAVLCKEEQLAKGSAKKDLLSSIKGNCTQYVHNMLDAISHNDLDRDHCGILNGNKLPHKKARKYVRQAITSYNIMHGTSFNDKGVLTVSDTAMIKSALYDNLTDGAQIIKGKLSNGVKFTYDKTTGMFTIGYWWVKEHFLMLVNGAVKCWNSFCEMLHNAYKAIFSKEENLCVAA